MNRTSWNAFLPQPGNEAPSPRQNSPVEAIIMAGGRGVRMRPMTDEVPKPLLKIGGKPILEFILEKLHKAGIRKVYVSVGYRGHQLREYLQDGGKWGLEVEFLQENMPMGTFWAARQVPDAAADNLLVINADILTDLDLTAFCNHYFAQGADLQVATRAFEVHVPYAVMEVAGDIVMGLEEKPTLRYYHNAGIYLFDKKFLSLIPENDPFDATEFLELLVNQGARVIQYPILGYWLDVGRPGDYEKAQDDIQHLQF